MNQAARIVRDEFLVTTVKVTRRVRDGWHVYTCDQLPGLYVASQDDCAAYDDLPEAITKLLELNFGAKVEVYHKTDYRNFINHLMLRDRAEQAVAERTDDMMSGGLPTYVSFVVKAKDGFPHHR